MAMTFNQRMVSSKIDILTEQKNYLQSFIDETNKVLQLSISWVRNDDGTNNVTFRDINKMIEDKLVFLSSTDFSVECKEINNQQECTRKETSPSLFTSSDKPLITRHDQVSSVNAIPGELKAIVHQVKMMQETMSFLNIKTEKILEKQLIMEKFNESLSVQCSKIEQERIRKIETELKNIHKKQKIACQDKTMKKLEKRIQDVSDAQSEITQNWQLQQTKRKEEKKENKRLEKQSQQLTQDLNIVLENIEELNTRIYLLEDQTLIESQMEYLENKVTFLQENSEKLTTKLEKHESLFEEFRRTTEETFENLSSSQKREFENLQKFEERITALEIAKSNTSQEPVKLGSNVQTKLDCVCDQMANLLPKISQLETESQGPVIGFSARVPICFFEDTATLLNNFEQIISNKGNQFNPATGEFTAPLDGLYATSLSVKPRAIGILDFSIVKLPSTSSCCNPSLCEEFTVDKIFISEDDRNMSVFVIVDLKVGEKLSVIYKSRDVVTYVPCNIVFTCFRIG